MEIKTINDMLSSFVCYCNGEMNREQLMTNLRSLGLPSEVLEHAEIMARRITPAPPAHDYFTIQEVMGMLQCNEEEAIAYLDGYVVDDLPF